jgi:hypothetical protein
VVLAAGLLLGELAQRDGATRLVVHAQVHADGRVLGVRGVVARARVLLGLIASPAAVFFLGEGERAG